MALHVPRAPGYQQMLKEGASYFTGMEEAVYRNIEACVELTHTTRSTLGPTGQSKIVINHIEKLFITSDAATILRELEVAHPAAKMLVLASQQQEQEVGDGTNLVFVLAGALLEQAKELLKMGVSVAEITEGYELALKKALVILEDLVIDNVNDIHDASQAIKAVRTALMSKQFGYEDLLADLIVKACQSASTADNRFDTDHVRVCKILGGGVLQSQVIRGMVFKRDTEGEVQEVRDCRVVVYGCPLDNLETETKGTVLITNAEELKEFSRGEENVMEQHILGIKEAGCRVVVSGGKVGELAIHFANKHGLLILRINSKWDIRRLCRAIGATALPRLTTPNRLETGHVSVVRTDEIGENRVVIFQQDASVGEVSTIVIRGSTENIMDDVERAVDDGVNAFKCLTRDGRLLPGAGATEAELARQLGAIADKAPGMEQYAIKKYAESLENVVKALAENAGMKGNDVVAKLHAAHQAGKVNTGLVHSGEEPEVADALEHGVLDLYLVKYWALKFATAAASTVLKVDHIIMSKPAGQKKSGE